MRLIDADELKKSLSDKDNITWTHEYGDAIPLEWIMSTIDNAPAVEARPQGEWKPVEGYDGDEYYECSNCGEPWVLYAGTPEENNMHFCPNCGADMRKGGAE